VPVRVRVKNFQSIEDAEIIIDGFVVICGPNNSGKTALMRAIRGLFTNAAPGSYLRQGANYLSVELEFDDGTTVLWEKGWEKPDKKGAAINRYTINGYQISSVGRGVPPEVEALGVKSILAGNTPVWPQVADQFDGTLFLVNKTGAVVAEALSDVERVGRLTDALRLSEKDKRSSTSELKVRREDLKSFQDQVARFKGLDRSKSLVEKASSQKSEVLKARDSLQEAKILQTRLSSCKEIWGGVKDFSLEIPPESPGIRKFSADISSLRSLHERMRNLQDSCAGFEGFSPPRWGSSEAASLRSQLLEARNLLQKMKKLQGDLSGLGDFQESQFSDSAKAEKIPKVLTVVRSFKSRKDLLEKNIVDLNEEEENVTQRYKRNEILIQSLLGERGYCPTCKTVHQNGAGGHS